MLTCRNGLGIVHYMLSTQKTETFVHESVKSGALEIKQDGSVWRVNQERGNRWNSIISLRPVPPHRIDSIMPHGYRAVKVMRSGKQVTTMAHRLVFFHFKGSIPLGLTINHKNGIRHDNRPDNLEIATYAEQVRHSREILGHPGKIQDGESNDMAKLTEKTVREIRRRRAAGEKLKSIAKDFGVSDKNVSKISLGQRWISLL